MVKSINDIHLGSALRMHPPRMRVLSQLLHRAHGTILPNYYMCMSAPIFIMVINLAETLRFDYEINVV